MENNKIHLSLVFAVVLGCGPIGTANAQVDDDEATSDVEIRVPRKLRNKGYRLRIADQEFELKGRKIVTEDSPHRYDVHLVGPDRTIEDSTFARKTEDLALNLSPTNVRLSLKTGASQADRGSFNELFSANSFMAHSLSGSLRLSSSNWLLASVAWVNGDEGTVSELRSRYRSRELRLGVARDFAPFSRPLYHRWLRKLQLTVSGGVLHAKDSFDLHDDHVSIRDEHASPGLFLGTEVSFLIWNAAQLWLVVAWDFAWHRVIFDDLNFRQDIMQSNKTLGVSYAF